MASFWEQVAKAFSRKESSNPWKVFAEVLQGPVSRSGVTINAARALEYSTVLACVRALSNGVAQVPVGLYRRESGRRVEVTDHPLSEVLSGAPSPGVSPFEFWERLMYHTVLTGNAYAFQNRVGNARRLRELVLLDPSRVTVRRAETGALSYDVRGERGEVMTFPAEAIWHVRGPSWNGWSGLDGVRLAKESIGLSIALEQDQAEFHANGARVSGILSVEGKLSKEQYENLAAWLDQHAAGGARFQKPMIVDNGGKFLQQRMTAVDAQALETRRFQVEEVCRAFGVLPIVIGYSDKTATYASAEQMFLAHVVHTMLPWYTRLEQSAAAQLLTERERKEGLYLRFNAAALLRGAQRDRAEYFKAALGSGGAHGWMTPNEVRALEELDRLDSPEADSLPVPAMNAPDSGGSDTPPTE